MSRSLSATALAAANAQQSSEVWLVLLRIHHASITPNGILRFVNNTVDIHRPPAANLLASSNPASWTLNTATQASNGAYTTLTDASATVSGNASTSASGLTAANTYTGAVRIWKDTIPAATRYAALQMVGAGGGTTTLYLDTSTGATSTTTSGTGTAVAAVVVDDGEAWLLYISRSGDTSYTLNVFPAIGKGTFGTGNNVNVQGSINANQGWLWAGDSTLIEDYIAYPFMIDLPGEDVTQPAVAKLTIDNVDLQIIQAVRGLPSAATVDIEVILASQPMVTEILLSGMNLRAIDYDVLQVTGNITFEEIFTEPVSLAMTPNRFPAMF